MTGWVRICQPHFMCSGQLSQMSTSWPYQIVCWPFLCKPLAKMTYICVLSMNATNIRSDVIPSINLQAQYLTGCRSNSQTCCALVALLLWVMEDNSTYKLVVQACVKKTGIKSVILTEWEWDPAYHVVDPDSLHSSCFVVSIKPDSSKVLEVLPLEEWPEQFTNSFD